MTVAELGIPFGAAVVAGVLNSAAGGGSFLSFPALLFVGFPPIVANATNSTAMWVGNIGSIGGFREDLDLRDRELIATATISVIGSMLGAIVLLHTSERLFAHAIPYLLGFATLVFACSPLFVGARPAGGREYRTLNAVSLFFASLYGGYFGAGVGIVIIALYSVTTHLAFARINARKNVLAFFINGAAVVPFALARVVDWREAAIMAAGAVIGAYGGAHVIRRLPQIVARATVVAIGIGMTAYFFLHG